MPTRSIGGNCQMSAGGRDEIQLERMILALQEELAETKRESESKVVSLKAKGSAKALNEIGFAIGPAKEFDRQDKKPFKIKQTLSNTRLAVQRYGLVFAYNEFTGK